VQVGTKLNEFECQSAKPIKTTEEQTAVVIMNTVLLLLA